MKMRIEIPKFAPDNPRKIIGYFVYEYEVNNNGTYEPLEHYYEDTQGEVFVYQERNYQYASDRHYFSGSPDWEQADKILEEKLEKEQKE